MPSHRLVIAVAASGALVFALATGSSGVSAAEPAAAVAQPNHPESGNGCDPNYSGCVPIASDVDCAGGEGDGPSYADGPVDVIGTDIYDLDSDGDGDACGDTDGGGSGGGGSGGSDDDDDGSAGGGNGGGTDDDDLPATGSESAYLAGGATLALFAGALALRVSRRRPV